MKSRPRRCQGYGLPAVKGGDRAEKARWCKSCSEAHAGAMPRAPRCEASCGA
jgi:hypothetical protein